MSKKQPLELTYARAWDVILHNAHTSAAEKLILIEICRYWPQAYRGSNASIAHNTGFSVRYVQKILKALSTGPEKRIAQGKSKRRAYIDRAYSHITAGGKRYTFRIIAPLCLPGLLKPPAPPTAREARRQISQRAP